ncbi:MAG: hypothetical protein WBB29_00980, partial [Geitlerinemataceae cyanobacterium]
MTTEPDLYALFETARQQGPNPFNKEKAISAYEVWHEVMTNLSSLNGHIDREIERAIDDIRKKYSSKIGLAIKGDRGRGKSHTIHRIWKKIAKEGGSIFAYIPPCDTAERMVSHVRLYLHESLLKPDVDGVTQWQKLAAAAIFTLKGTEYEEEYQEYVDRCDRPNELKQHIIATKGRKLNRSFLDFFDDLTDAIVDIQTELDFDFTKAILFTLFNQANLARAGLSWIKGDDNPNIKTAGLPESIQDESRSLWMIQKICKLAEVASCPVLICFDQLDSAAPDYESGDSPAQVVARCIDRIYFQCTNVLLICCVISDTWREIEIMGSGIPDRVGERSITALAPTAEQMIEIVKLRLAWFYREKNLNPADYPDLYPFKENQIIDVARQSAGVRSLLEYCEKQFDREAQPPENSLLNTFNDLLNKVSTPHSDDEIAEILKSVIKIAHGDTIENFDIGNIDSLSRDIHLKIIASEAQSKREVKIGIRVCESTHPNSFNSAIKKILNYDKLGIEKGCLIRSTPIPKSWKKGQELKNKLESQHGEVVVLKKEEIKPLIAIHKIYQQSEDYGFKKNDLIQLIKEMKLVISNP